MQNSSNYSQHDRMMMIATAIEQRHRMLELQRLREENEYLHQQQQILLQQQQQLQKNEQPHTHLSYHPAPLSEQTVLQQQQAQPGLQQLHPYVRAEQCETPTPTSAAFHQRLQEHRSAALREAQLGAVTPPLTSAANTTTPLLSPPTSGVAVRTSVTAGAAAIGTGGGVRARQPPAHLPSTHPVSVEDAMSGATKQPTVSAPVYAPTVSPQHAQFVDMTTCSSSMMPFGLHDEAFLRRIGALAPAATPAEEQGETAEDAYNVDAEDTADAEAMEPSTGEVRYTPSQGVFAMPQQQQQLAPRPLQAASLATATATAGKTVVPTPRSQQQQQQVQVQVHVDATPNHQASKSIAHQHRFAWTGCSVPSAGYSPAPSSALGLTVSANKQQYQQRQYTGDKDESTYTEDGVSHNLEDSLCAEQDGAAASVSVLASKHQPTMVRKVPSTPAIRATPPQTELGKAMQQLIHQIQQRRMSSRSEIAAACDGVPALEEKEQTGTPPAQPSLAAEALSTTTTVERKQSGKGRTPEASVTETPASKPQPQQQQQHELRDTPPSSRRRPLSPNSRSLHVIKIVTPKGSGTGGGSVLPLADAPGSRQGSERAAVQVGELPSHVSGNANTAANASAEEQEGYRHPSNARRSLQDCLEATPNASRPLSLGSSGVHANPTDRKTRQQQKRLQQQQEQQMQKARGASIVEMLSRQHQDLVINSTSKDTATAATTTTAAAGPLRSRNTVPNSGNSNCNAKRQEYFDVLVEGHMNTRREVTSYAALEPGTYVLFEGDRGVDMGRVVSCHRRSENATAAGDGNSEKDETNNSNGHNGNAHRRRSGGARGGAPLVLRSATAEEQDRWLHKQTADAAETIGPCREAVAALKLPLEIVGAVYQFNREKLTFFYESDSRVDFRQLLQSLFSRFHCRIWMERVTTDDREAEK